MGSKISIWLQAVRSQIQTNAFNHCIPVSWQQMPKLCKERKLCQGLAALTIIPQCIGVSDKV